MNTIQPDIEYTALVRVHSLFALTPKGLDFIQHLEAEYRGELYKSELIYEAEKSNIILVEKQNTPL
jgi:hypothetical protein